MNTYRAYLENGKIIPVGNPVIPEGCRITITIFDEDETEDISSRQLKAMERFQAEMQTCNESLPEEFFDELINNRVNITRELDL